MKSSYEQDRNKEANLFDLSIFSLYLLANLTVN